MADRSSWRFQARRWLRLGPKSFTATRTGMQARQPSQ
jgi:hypothetical protein